ncbi:MAG TPA: hypothetical protein VLC28_04155 [Flavitalea sp.]|nr:hypothetical protein [Flavitalea sp.]
MLKKTSTYLLAIISFTVILSTPVYSIAQEDNAKKVIPPAFASSDTMIQQAFQWASAMALSYRGDPADKVGPWYEAALPARDAFCMRDVSHQSIGAEILGMSAENQNMFRWFSKSISESKDWCSYWEINKDGVPAPVDYANDKEFWYNLNANFDVLYAQWKLYEWTGNRIYIDDPAFINFQQRTVNEYIDRWILQADSLITRHPHPNAPVPYDSNNSFHSSRGMPSYSEGAGELIMGVDLVASIYRALITYAGILEFKGEKGKAQQFITKAATYKKVLEQQWWDKDAQLYFTYYNTDKKFGKQEGETFLLWFDALSDTHRLEKTISHIATQKWNAENTSYLPYLFYKFGYWKEAKDYIKILNDPATERREYPEVSYGVIEGIVHGLMGISPSASKNVLTTLLRDDGSHNYKVSGLHLLNTTVSVEHLDANSTIVRNDGKKGFIWQGCFQGTGKQALVNGRPSKLAVKTGKDHQQPISYLNIFVKPGAQVKVELR